jgi:hypothetical protein
LGIYVDLLCILLQDRALFNLCVLLSFLWSRLSVRIIKSTGCMLQPQK